MDTCLVQLSNSKYRRFHGKYTLNVDGRHLFMLEHPITLDYERMTKGTYAEAHLDKIPDNIALIYANIEDVDIIRQGDLMLGWKTKYMHVYPPPEVINRFW